MKRVLCGLLLIALLVLPGLGLTEGEDTIRLARTLYTLGQGESYDTLLMLGSVVMNRVESPWYPDTVKDVLGEPHQFPRGTLYDEESLQAARDVMMGRRALPKYVVLYAALDSTKLPEGNELYISSDNYGFYYRK